MGQGWSETESEAILDPSAKIHCVPKIIRVATI